MLIQVVTIVNCRGMQLIMFKLTTQRDTIWFFMLAHMSFCHTLGTRILIIIMHNSFSSFKPRDNNLRFKDNNLRHRVNSFKLRDNNLRFKCNNLRLRINSYKYKTLRLRFKDS